MVASHSNHPARRPVVRSLLAALFWLATVVPAFAIVDVRDETWTLPASVPGRISVDFTADVSDGDVFDGVHFAVALRAGETAPRALVRYRTAAIPNLPDPGQPVLFRVVFDLACDANTGVVRGIPVECMARFCVSGRGYRWSPIHEVAQPESTTASGAFGLTVLDEDGVGGASPTSLDALVCGGTTAPSARTTAAPNARTSALPAPAPSKNTPRRILDADAATIGIYFDPEGTQCQGTIAPGAIDTVYVLAKLGTSDDSYCGIAGAEFRFAGIPASWHPSPVLHADLLGIGNPFTEGVTVVSAQCRRPPNGVVLLFTVLVLAETMVPDVTFSIEGRQPPTNALFPCPLVLACDDPVFTKICVQGQACFVNPTVARKCPAPTAVSTTTWSVLKSLYR